MAFLFNRAAVTSELRSSAPPLTHLTPDAPTAVRQPPLSAPPLCQTANQQQVDPWQCPLSWQRELRLLGPCSLLIGAPAQVADTGQVLLGDQLRDGQQPEDRQEDNLSYDL